MRFVFRFVSLLALLATIAVGGLDAVRYVASDVISLTDFASVLAFLGLEWPEAALQGLAGGVWRYLLSAPAVAILLAASFVLWLPSYRRPRPAIPAFARQT